MLSKLISNDSCLIIFEGLNRFKRFNKNGIRAKYAKIDSKIGMSRKIKEFENPL